jgi:SAM-dependent methyltransferase
MASRLSPYRLLEVPAIYTLAQNLLAPGFRGPFVEQVRRVAGSMPAGERQLDIACGPESWTWEAGLDPVGLDLLPSYVDEFTRAGRRGIVASATELPFGEGTFDAVWCFALLHHLPDEAARRAIAEMMRVATERGYCVIWEIVLPKRSWTRPIAWLIRKLDRGGTVRLREDLFALFPKRSGWRFEHYDYTFYGLEGYFCVLDRGGQAPQRELQS